MKQWNRLVFFLLLNILVSGCTTFAVLYIWDRFRASLPGGVIPSINIGLPKTDKPSPTAPVAQNEPLPQAAATPTYLVHTVVDGDTFESIAQTYRVGIEELVSSNGYNQVQILSPGELIRVPIHPLVIETVIGAGDLATERIVLISTVDNELDLFGWKLEDGTGNLFTLPQLTLNLRGGTVNVFTKPGSNSSTDLYWGLQAPVWSSGETVILRDPQGTIQAQYSIP